MSDRYEPEAAPSALASTLIRHAAFDRILDDVLESLSDPAGAPLILCLGAPGWGKSRLGAAVAGIVAAAHVDAMRADPNLVPVVRVEAHAPDAGRTFSWREALLEVLAQLGERGVGLRANVVPDPLAGLAPRGTSGRARNEPQLQLDVIDGLRAHGTKLLWIDEIEHIVYQRDVARFEATADILKTITNETGVQILATGSYEGLGLRNVSGQVFRRRRFLHLERYHADVAHEYAEYARVVVEMLAVIGCADDPAPLIPILYRQTLGVVGMTADFLMQAEHAWRWQGETLLYGIARHARSDGDLAVVAEALRSAEASLAPKPDIRAELDALLGLAGTPTPAVSPARRGKKGAPRPGRRAPSRDLVGVSRVA